MFYAILYYAFTLRVRRFAPDMFSVAGHDVNRVARVYCYFLLIVAAPDHDDPVDSQREAGCWDCCRTAWPPSQEDPGHFSLHHHRGEVSFICVFVPCFGDDQFFLTSEN